ncbi:MAG TPA: hypothetical protein VD932_04110 [Aquabacterium sp.]|nr:hypothetical protein [Aquabacterium sp.]
MMGLGRYIGREHAHDLIYDICREAAKRQCPLLDPLAARPQIGKHRAVLHWRRCAIRPTTSGSVGVMVDRVLASLR